MIRKKLVKLWRTVRGEIADPVAVREGPDILPEEGQPVEKVAHQNPREIPAEAAVAALANWPPWPLIQVTRSQWRRPVFV
jgi:hypothetical protein